MGRFHVLETPLALDRYKQASTELLTMLDQVVYPALREDPANESGKYPIRFRPGGFTFEIETPGGGLHYLVYQVIEELGPRPRPGPRHLSRTVGAGARRSTRLITDGSRSSPQPAAL